MLAEKGCALIKELNRNPDTLPPYNTELVTEVSKEVVELVQQNDFNDTDSDILSLGVAGIPTNFRVNRAAIRRNLRCLKAYHYNRLRCLRTMRWEFGSILPADIKENLSTNETKWFNEYSTLLATYMRSIGEEGVNLTVDLYPPKSLYIEVKTLVDYGRYELSDGTVLLLKKNSRHFLPRAECEELIRQGIFQHISSS